MRSWSVKVSREEGESARKKLLELGALDTSLRIRREGDCLLIPVVDIDDLNDYELVEAEFEQREVPIGDYRRLIELPDELHSLLPTSFDVIGDIAVIKLPDELLPHAEEAGRALMIALPRLRSVLLDRGVEGELRVRDLRLVAGSNETETTHTEYGIRLRVDPSRVYFNPRLANERRRVASMVGEGEVVIDMFAGVGPFSIMISRHSGAGEIYAVDLNPDAIYYMRKNIHLNKAENITAIEGDARDALPGLPQADRIIMNLPHSAHEFLEEAASALRKGGVIHLYMISERERAEERVEQLLSELKERGIILEIIRLSELKTYSPTMSVYSIDLVKC